MRGGSQGLASAASMRRRRARREEAAAGMRTVALDVHDELWGKRKETEKLCTDTLNIVSIVIRLQLC